MRKYWLGGLLLGLMSGCTDDPTQSPVTDQQPDAGAGALQVESAVTRSQPEVEQQLLPGVRFYYLEANGIRMRVAEMGSGPAVLLAHGWPESWYSWRHQLRALSRAGYRVLAPDMRGYGETDAPAAVEDYNLVALAADMVGILDALDIEVATMVGHDWGSPVAAQAVLRYPGRFNGLVLLSVPHGPRGSNPPLTAMRERVGDNFFYMLYHNEPGGVAEAEYDADPRGLLRRIYQSPDAPRQAPEVTDPKRAAGGFISRIGAPDGLPDWLTEADLDYYVSQFEQAGFRGGVNYYRNFDRNWELTADLAGEQIPVPTLYIAGAQDMVIGSATAEALTMRMSPLIPDLKDAILLPGIGHWVQQEAPEPTNQAILDFLGAL
jgi:pimeloyl-ACP methyl ester carboxylesterase